DDDELFGEAPIAAAPPADIAPRSPVPPAPHPPITAAPAPAGVAPAAPEPRVAPRPEPRPEPELAAKPVPKPAVVEFADEIVEVRKSAPAQPAKAAKADDAPIIGSKQRVLQFSKNAASSTVLGDDVGQMSSGVRALVFALVLAGMVALAWAVMTFVR
ncbi:MAG: hypothetical protein KDC98_15070, partial [Planctomycetes bacterium]|nr:hypothetical protein [Planctomycetota bacterium]